MDDDLYAEDSSDDEVVPSGPRKKRKTQRMTKYNTGDDDGDDTDLKWRFARAAFFFCFASRVDAELLKPEFHRQTTSGAAGILLAYDILLDCANCVCRCCKNMLLLFSQVLMCCVVLAAGPATSAQAHEQGQV